ncbi:hypothetical protein VKT23_007626 [Stygiomarasmius scandens]|uniref:RING-type domain-containing protein n=1 Tax=Marasmiellus scandens TaxID=2682957 RepID=A0ABR1JLC6_9AGAR
MAQTPVDNIHGLGVVNNNTTNTNGKDKKGPDSLFGPNVGVISSGPGWTAQTEKKVLKDELTMDVVKGWIEKSKEPSQPTTTLQALVNLKRPTIRLSPLTDDDDNDIHHSHHGLEFEYDCDAPRCGIYVHVLLPPGHPDAPGTTDTSGSASPTPPSSDKPRLSKVLVFETVTDGGFGKMLKLEQGAVLELARFDGARAIKPKAATANSEASVSTAGATATAAATDAASNSNGNLAVNNTNNGNRHSRRRLTHFFHRRHNNHNMSVSGPALAVVDASSSPNDPNNTNNNNSSDNADGKSKKAEDLNNGVRVTIRLAALDEQGTELASPNEQVTYLCVERFGTKPVKTPAVPAEGQAEGETSGEAPKPAEEKDKEEEEEEDTRPWVVKVVKREATIGPHTFHLHEIYGLTSSSSTTSTHAHAPTAPLPSSQQHTYPPSSGQALPAQGEDHGMGDDTPSECLLCLSSPREVVLLPCRHLVACKDCALNMVEFGAGGNITQASGEETAAAGAGDAAGATTTGAGVGEGAGATTTMGAGAAATTTTQNPRRKRKAKGWFCPVCRQPYTSLLRITTNPPPLAGGKTSADQEREEHDVEGEGEGEGEDEVDIGDSTDPDAIPPRAPASANSHANGNGELPLPVTTNVPGAGAAGAGASASNASVNNATNSSGDAAGEASSSGGLFGRPGFLRGLTGKSKNGNANASTRDLESQL